MRGSQLKTPKRLTGAVHLPLVVTFKSMPQKNSDGASLDPHEDLNPVVAGGGCDVAMGLVDQQGKTREGRTGKRILHGDGNAEFLLDAGQHAHHGERITAELQELMIPIHLFDVQHPLPDRRNLCFGGGQVDGFRCG